MEGNHANWTSIIYKKAAVHNTEIEELFLAVKASNTNLVHLLQLYHVLVGNVHVCPFMCTISHMHGQASKTVLCAQYLVYEKL